VPHFFHLYRFYRVRPEYSCIFRRKACPVSDSTIHKVHTRPATTGVHFFFFWQPVWTRLSSSSLTLAVNIWVLVGSRSSNGNVALGESGCRSPIASAYVNGGVIEGRILVFRIRLLGPGMDCAVLSLGRWVSYSMEPSFFVCWRKMLSIGYLRRHLWLELGPCFSYHRASSSAPSRHQIRNQFHHKRTRWHSGRSKPNVLKLSIPRSSSSSIIPDFVHNLWGFLTYWCELAVTVKEHDF